MADSLATFSPAQKEEYLGTVNEVINSKQQLWGWLDKVPADGGGTIATLNTGSVGTTTQRGLHFVVHTSRNASGGFQDPEGNFPTAGNQGYVQAYMQGRTMYWPMQVSRAAIARTRGNDAAFARVMVEAAVRSGNDVKNEIDRIAWGDGSGTLATMSGAATGAGPTYVFPIDNVQDLRKFSIGKVIAMWSSRLNGATQTTFGTGATYNNVAKVTGITKSSATPSVTVSAVAGTFGALSGTPGAAGTVLVNASVDTTQGASATINGARTSTLRYEFMGIDGIVLDCDSPMETTFGLFGVLAPTQYGNGINAQGASGATNASGVPVWSAYVNRSTANRAYNDALMTTLFDIPSIEYGEEPNLLASSYGGQWEYVNSKLPIRRYVNTPSLSGEEAGGYKVNDESKMFPEFRGVPLIRGRFAPTWNLTNTQGAALNATYFGLNLNTIKVCEWHPIRFMDDDGLTWRMIQRTPFFEAILEYTCEMYTFARNAHSKAINVLATDGQ